MTAEQAQELFTVAQKILVVDGDRDHMNQSNLKCEFTCALGEYLRRLAESEGAKDPYL